MRCNVNDMGHDHVHEASRSPVAYHEILDRVIAYLPPEEIEAEAMQQIRETAALPIVFHHVAVMPDCHVGKGATVGTVIATRDAVIPAAVGVDIGCGMIAVRTTLHEKTLRAHDLTAIRRQIERRIPSSAGHDNETISRTAAPRVTRPASGWR